MQHRWARFATATTLAVAVSGSGVLLTAGSASASTPIVVGSCATTIQGAPGTPVELSPSAVMAPVTNLVQALDPLNLITPTFRSSFAALPPIPLGALPTGSGSITGAQIASSVTAQLRTIPVLGPIIGLLAGQVQSTLTSMCGMGVTGLNAAAGPVQDGTGAIAGASQRAAQQAGLAPKSGGAPGSGGTPSQTGGGSTPAPQSGGSGAPASSNSPVVGGMPMTGSSLFSSDFGSASLLDYGLAQSPLSRYAGIPFASAGLFAPAPGVRYGGQVPGYAPQYGVLGPDGTVAPPGVQTAGHAEALGPGAGGSGLPNDVGLPMLLAVLALAGVTAALVRTWVLRRVRPA